MMHKKHCKCFICEHGKEAYDKQVEKGLKEHGFIIHCIEDAPDCPNQTNYHTHGVSENFGHADIQLCYPLPENLIFGIFHNIVGMIKAGTTFEADKEYNDILKGYKVKFINATENGRMVLRCILPNRDGKYNGKNFTDQFFKTGL